MILQRNALDTNSTQQSTIDMLQLILEKSPRILLPLVYKLQCTVDFMLAKAEVRVPFLSVAGNVMKNEEKPLYIGELEVLNGLHDLNEKCAEI